MATKLELETENAELRTKYDEMQAQLQLMMKKIDSMSTSPTSSASIVDKTSLMTRKINVISLIPNPATLSTEKGGGGKTFHFPAYGSKQKIRMDDLENIVILTKQIAQETQLNLTTGELPTSFFERGEFYICDAEAVEEVGLTDCYETILDKSKIDKIVNLADDISVSLFEGANSKIKENIVTLIIDKIVGGTVYDYNRLHQISTIYGRDINEMAENVKKIKE